MIEAIAYSGMERGGLGDDLLKVVGLKTMNENTATGEILWPRDLLREVLLEAAKNELRFTIHSVCAGNEPPLAPSPRPLFSAPEPPSKGQQPVA